MPCKDKPKISRKQISQPVANQTFANGEPLQGFDYQNINYRSKEGQFIDPQAVAYLHAAGELPNYLQSFEKKQVKRLRRYAEKAAALNGGPSIYKCAQLRNISEVGRSNRAKGPQGPALSSDLLHLRKKAYRKKVSRLLAASLMAFQSSPVFPQYKKMFDCQAAIYKKGAVLSATSCSSRLCPICNARRTAKLIDRYKKMLESFECPVFVTLTIPNVTAENLRPAIERMHKVLARIKDRLRKKGKSRAPVMVLGVRKYECTFRPPEFVGRRRRMRGGFHPHFHFILEGNRRAAKVLLLEWLKEFPEANRGGQKIVKIDRSNEKALFEIFKYTTKSLKEGTFYPDAVDVMARSILGKRIFQPMGVKGEQAQALKNAEIVEEMEIHTLTDPQLLSASDGWYNHTRTGEWHNKGEILFPVVFKAEKIKILEAFARPIYAFAKSDEYHEQNKRTGVFAGRVIEKKLREAAPGLEERIAANLPRRMSKEQAQREKAYREAQKAFDFKARQFKDN